jgi:hypothetical protein
MCRFGRIVGWVRCLPPVFGDMGTDLTSLLLPYPRLKLRGEREGVLDYFNSLVVNDILGKACTDNLCLGLRSLPVIPPGTTIIMHRYAYNQHGNDLVSDLVDTKSTINLIFVYLLRISVEYTKYMKIL